MGDYETCLNPLRSLLLFEGFSTVLKGSSEAQVGLSKAYPFPFSISGIIHFHSQGKKYCKSSEPILYFLGFLIWYIYFCMLQAAYNSQSFKKA